MRTDADWTGAAIRDGESSGSGLAAVRHRRGGIWAVATPAVATPAVATPAVATSAVAMGAVARAAVAGVAGLWLALAVSAEGIAAAGETPAGGPVAGASAAGGAAGAAEGGTARKALQPLQGLVGEWRGAGQVRRGSPDGGWTEESAWVWRFDGQKAALQFTVARGKYFVSGLIQPGATVKSVELIAKTAGGREVKYAGEIAEDGSVTATTADPQAPADAPQRVSLRVVANGDRLVMLLERRSAISDRYARLAEIGYTRRGSEFGKGTSQPECVVTGGLGTIQVSYKGQMYFVCCAGCRDLFEQKPDEILTEYRERKQAEAAKKKKG